MINVNGRSDCSCVIYFSDGSDAKDIEENERAAGIVISHDVTKQAVNRRANEAPPQHSHQTCKSLIYLKRE